MKQSRKTRNTAAAGPGDGRARAIRAAVAQHLAQGDEVAVLDGKDPRLSLILCEDEAVQAFFGKEE
jgi:hypothetical protein